MSASMPTPAAAPQILPYRGILPRIHPSAWIAPGAVLVGDIEIGPESSVWYNAVLRADTAPLRIGARTNVQDGTVIHLNAGEPTTIGDDVTIGHSCIVHACTLENRAFVGMGALVLDRAVIAEGGMVGARALLSPGKRVGPNELWLGAPARLARVMSAEERAGFDRTAAHYVGMAREHRASLGGS